MRAAFRSQHRRNSSLSTVPPPRSSSDYSFEHASIAASILYRSPLLSQSGLPVYILNAAAFPDAFEVDYDTLLAYVLARLPGEEELIAGEDYEVIFFAGGQPESATSEKKNGPGIGWYLQTYHVLSRAVRKRLKMLYVVHERSWVRVLIEVFGTIVSPKFKKKIVHVNSMSGLALHLPIERLLIPPSVYLHDRRVSQDIYAPYVSGRRAFAADEPLPGNLHGERRLPRVLRETTTFLCRGENIKTEGLFRIPAHSQINGILREAYDRGQQFIIWREGPVTWVQPGMDQTIVREVHQSDCYGVHSAAGLIKLWYRELKRPIFEEASYDEVRHRFGAAQEEITLMDLTEIFSPASQDSFLSLTARQILTRHLLPLLAIVVMYQSANKMTAENLAICFAPAMVCGGDQLVDAKISSIVKRILEAAVVAWPNGLREACNATDEAFAIAISPPKDQKEYEDPLHEGYKPPSRGSVDDEPHRIVLQDDEQGPGNAEKPPLPPRPRASSKPTTFPARQDSLSSPVKRKPAPPPSVLPRYSAVVGDDDLKTTKSSGISPINSDVPRSNTDEKTPTSANSESAPPYQAPLNVIPATPRRSQDNFMAELRASLATDSSKRKPVSSPVSPPSPILESPEKHKQTLQQRSVSGDAPPTATKDSVFARPTWAASSRQVSLPSVPQSQASSTGTKLAAPAPTFKARTSPGLLKRMTSMELKSAEDRQKEAERLISQKLSLKKASVDDLRRLYEERANTVSTLNSAPSSRRGSNVSSLSRKTSNASLM